MWKVGIIEELLQVKDGQIRAARMNCILKWLRIEKMKDTTTELYNERINISDGRSRRDTAILWEVNT